MRMNFCYGIGMELRNLSPSRPIVIPNGNVLICPVIYLPIILILALSPSPIKLLKYSLSNLIYQYSCMYYTFSIFYITHFLLFIFSNYFSCSGIYSHISLIKTCMQLYSNLWCMDIKITYVYRRYKHSSKVDLEENPLPLN